MNYSFWITSVIISVFIPFFALADVKGSNTAYIAIPKKDIVVKSPIDLPAIKVYPIEKLKIVRENYVLYEIDGQKKIVSFGDDHRTYREKGYLRSKGVVFADFEHTYIFLDKGHGYKVLSEDGDRLIVQAYDEGMSQQASVAKDNFHIMTEQDYQAAISKLKQEKQALIKKKKELDNKRSLVQRPESLKKAEERRANMIPSSSNYQATRQAELKQKVADLKVAQARVREENAEKERIKNSVESAMLTERARWAREERIVDARNRGTRSLREWRTLKESYLKAFERELYSIHSGDKASAVVAAKIRSRVELQLNRLTDDLKRDDDGKIIDIRTENYFR